jgi:hypothetical protein
MPGVLIVEALAQAAGVLAVESLGLADSGKLVYFMAIDGAKFRTPVEPGVLLQLEMLRRFNIQKGFFGAHGLNLPEGLTDVSADEAEVKRAMVEMCRQTVAVLDATKWGRVGLASFARPEQINTVITDADAPANLVERVRVAGIEVVIV